MEESKEMKKLIEEYDEDLIEELLDEFNEDLIIAYEKSGYDLKDMQEAYQGKFDSDEEFVEDLTRSLGDIPRDLPWYIHIDWEKTAKEVMMDYFEIDGHYFRIF